jgi:hypothetical protein
MIGFPLRLGEDLKLELLIGLLQATQFFLKLLYFFLMRFFEIIDQGLSLEHFLVNFLLEMHILGLKLLALDKSLIQLLLETGIRYLQSTVLVEDMIILTNQLAQLLPQLNILQQET